MGSFSIAMGFFLLLAFWLPGHIGANPVYSAVSNTDLMDFKNLLDHLEEKMPLEDEVVPPQALSEQNDEAPGAALNSLPEVPPWTGEVNPPQREGSTLGRSSWEPSDRSALLKSKLRALLAAPRSLRRSSCFGGRIDRIGAQSGLGCNSFRVRGTVDGNGMEVGWESKLNTSREYLWQQRDQCKCLFLLRVLPHYVDVPEVSRPCQQLLQPLSTSWEVRIKAKSPLRC
ncbi:natriuretic peptide type A [Cricetulus griseus]